jgi:putative phosphoribosyl transferase
MEQRVRLAAGGVRLAADLAIPAAANGVVLFAHGSGSGRLSPRNRLVAAKLQQAGLATLLLDLLTAEEETAERAGGRRRFDVQLLAGRLAAALDWLATGRRTGGLPVGLFGASTGAGAALLVAADRPAAVAAVVSRSGRPDLAGAVLGRVRAPTLLVVGGRDRTVLALNRAWRGWPAGPGWRSCPAPATCSRSQVPWSAWPSWPLPGSSRTWPGSSPPSRPPPRPSRSPAQEGHGTLWVRTAHGAHHNTSVRVRTRSPLCGAPFPQVDPDRQGRS